MVNLGQTPVGGLDLDGGCVVLDAENIVETGLRTARSGGEMERSHRECEELGGGHGWEWGIC